MGHPKIETENTREMDGERKKSDSGIKGLLRPAQNLVRYCTAPCQGEEPVDVTYYAPNTIQKGICTNNASSSVVQRGLCTSSAANLICVQREPYTVEISESNSLLLLGDVPEPPRRRRKERFNYAKALLRSDKELEKFSWKIRNQIHATELQEVAMEAERSAKLGESSFSSSRLSFSNADAVSDRNLLRGSHNRQASPSRSWNGTERPGVSLFSLQPVESVIPSFKLAHTTLQKHASKGGYPFPTFSEIPRDAQEKNETQSPLRNKVRGSALLDQLETDLSRDFEKASMKTSISCESTKMTSSVSEESHDESEDVLKGFFYYGSPPPFNQAETQSSIVQGAGNLCYSNENGAEISLVGLLTSAIKT